MLGRTNLARMMNRSTTKDIVGHWAWWLGLCLAGLCGGVVNHIGGAADHPFIGALIGGALGGWLFQKCREFAVSARTKRS